MYNLERRVPGTSKLNHVGSISGLDAAVNYLQATVGYVSAIHGIDEDGYELTVTEGQKSVRYVMKPQEKAA